jgi:hypothetical protein
MAYSTFQSVTGPSGPEGVKAVGVVGGVGNIGPTGSTGSNSAYLSGYEYPFDGNRSKAKLIFSDTTSIIIDAVTGPNAFPITEQDIPTNQSNWPVGSYIGLTAGGENIGSSGRIFVSQSYGPGTGTTFELRGLTASGDLQLYVTDTHIYIGGTGGATGGYVDQGITGQFLHLDPRWQAQGASGSFFGASADNTGTGDSITVKFRNVIDEVTDEFDSAFCGRVFHTSFDLVEQRDLLREYILDVSSLVRYVDSDGVTFGNMCVSVSPELASDRIVILRTKVNDPQATKKLKYPLWGASKINFEDPLSGNVSFLDEGYGNDEERREIVAFNTPYINDSEGYPSGDGVESNIHPMTWNQSDDGDAIPCPTEQAIIYDSGCKSNDQFIGARFRDKAFCTNGSLKIEGYTAASYCLRITQDMFESENTLDPWFGKIRLVVMPSCDVTSQGEEDQDNADYGFRLGCKSGSCCDHTSTECCTGGGCGEGGITSTETITGRINLDITNTNFFHVKAPFQIAGITWSYKQRPGLSLGSDDGVDYAEMKNITLVVEDGPDNIAFPDNVFFAGNPKFTSGIDILNLATVDNGKTWFATMTGYGWDIDVFKSSTLGSCCTNLNCVDFVSDEYCASISGLFESEVACANRTEEVCGAGIPGACCTGVGDFSIEYVCDDDAPTICDCIENPDLDDCPNSGDYGEIDMPGCAGGWCAHFCFGDAADECSEDPGGGSGNCCESGSAVPGDCSTCLPSCVGSCCTKDNEGNHICFPIKDCCEAAVCKEHYGDCAHQNIACANRNPDYPTTSNCERFHPYDGSEYPAIDPCTYSDKFCCGPCSLGGLCLPYSGSSNSSLMCPNGIVDDCSECNNITATSVARPVCLTPATALSCNLINGYFVPEDSVIPPQVPCDICNGIDACSPFEFGTCCNTFSGECYGTGLTETQCAVNLNSQWTIDVEDCAICCPQKEYRGACCLCENQCIDNVTPQQCSAIQGIFMGQDSLCSNVNCLIAGTCDCVCEGQGCCNCEGSSSPCCGDSSSSDCCGDGDCCDPVGCGCNTGVECCPDGTPQPCDDPPECPNPPCRGDRGDRGARDDGDGFDYVGARFGGGGGGGGIGDPRSDWVKGSCCFFGGNCYDGVWVDSRNDGSFDPNSSVNSKCKGNFSLEPCFMSNCPKTKFIGSCCCLSWTLDCPAGDTATGVAGDCSSCSVKDTKVTCSNCDFDGNIPGFTRPWDGASGPYKPMLPGYPQDVFTPTDRKWISPKPRDAYVTPEGIHIPYRWTDCCKNPGGCQHKPCVLQDRIDLGMLGLIEGQCQGGIGDQCGAGNPNFGHGDWCNIVDGTTTPPQGCDVTEAQKANDICDWCNLESVCQTSGWPCNPNIRNTVSATAGTLDDISELSACDGCDCLPPPVCQAQAAGPCEQYVFSSCRFVYDKSSTPSGTNAGPFFGTSCDVSKPTATPTSTPATGGNGSVASGTTFNPSSMCESRMGEIWGPNIKDPSVDTTWSNPFNTQNPLTSDSQSTSRFRGLNNTVVPNISQRDGVYTMRFIQR